MNKLGFILNPNAGINNAKLSEKVEKELLGRFSDYKFYTTQHENDGFEKACKLSNEGFDVIVAIGGDGTVNDVAKALVGSRSKLAIFPTGSGNGLARYLKIPSQLNLFLKKLNYANTKAIDVTYINGTPMFNIGGLGFDAVVSHEFQYLAKRGLSSYARCVLSNIRKYKPIEVCIEAGEIEFKGKVFMLSFASGSQFGNNFTINPKAKIDDGKIELCLMEPFPPIQQVRILYQMLTKTVHHSKFLKIIPVSNAKITTLNPEVYHIDGDPQPPESHLEIQVIKQGLNVVV